jgi:hypothetical protein
MIAIDKSVEERFWAKVNKTDGCWEWIGATASGYGYFKCYEGNRNAHRVSWTIHNGQIPEKLMVLHHCDNKICVRPDHLFLGTAKDNALDLQSKGLDPFTGTKNSAAKLTEKQVLEIRERWPTYKGTQKELAAEYGVTQSRIWYIVNRKHWKHI